MSSPSKLRPLRMGELIDRAARFWRAHLWPLFQIYLAIQLVTFGAAQLFQLAMRRWFPLFQGGSAFQRAVEEDLGSVLGQLPALGIGVGVFALAVFTLHWLAEVCATRLAVDRLLGEGTTVRQALGHVRRRLWRVLGTAALALAYLLLTCAVSLLPGTALLLAAVFFADQWSSGAILTAVLVGMLLALAGLVVALLWYALRFVVTVQVVAMEDQGAFGALHRSARLLSGRVGPGFTGRVKVRAAILLTLVLAILFAISALADLPQLVVMGVYGAFSDPDGLRQIPAGLLIPTQLFQVCVQAVFAPLYVAFGAFLYVDLRARKEGLDLELRLRSLETGAGA